MQTIPGYEIAVRWDRWNLVTNLVALYRDDVYQCRWEIAVFHGDKFIDYLWNLVYQGA